LLVEGMTWLEDLKCLDSCQGNMRRLTKSQGISGKNLVWENYSHVWGNNSV